jgi:hypothetical protein
MAFPVPVDYDSKNYVYNETGWIDVLHQLREASPYINTIRLYRLPPTVFLQTPQLQQSSLTVNDNNPSLGFFQEAARLGFYVVVPLTAVSGDGVLDRDLKAPSCYKYKLYNYGKKLVDTLQVHPNILGGVIGNEVMNNLLHWHSAPCLLAYARDLKRYMNGNGKDDDQIPRRSIPLIYATQHDGIGASVSPSEQSQLILNYMTCSHGDEKDDCSAVNPVIDIFGINIESWCSSLQTYEQNEDGSIGTFYNLYQQLENSTIPIIFTELGCSQLLFDRDNGMRVNPLSTTLGARTWNELSVVENEMNGLWSGYIAYAYDGPTDFRMTDGGPWKESHTLEFNQDMNNFLFQLNQVGNSNGNSTVRFTPLPSSDGEPVSCVDVQKELSECCKLDLLDVKHVQSFYATTTLAETVAEFNDWINHFFRRDGVGSTGSTKMILRNGSIGIAFCALFGGILGIVVVLFFVTRVTKRRWQPNQRLLTPGNLNTQQVNYSTF